MHVTSGFEFALGKKGHTGTHDNAWIRATAESRLPEVRAVLGRERQTRLTGQRRQRIAPFSSRVAGTRSFEQVQFGSEDEAQ